MSFLRQNLNPRFFTVPIIAFVAVLLSFNQVIYAESSNQTEPLIGINVPLSGPYQAQGKDQLRAYKLAIERLNEQGGLLGNQIEYKVKDTKTNPSVAIKNAQKLIKKNQAVMLTGGISSAVAIAQSEICQQKKVLFMCAVSHSTATTGFEGRKGMYGEQKAHRHTFRWFFNAWMTQEALTPYLIQELGSGKDYYYITADYTWGRSLEHAIRHATESAGCNTLGAIKTPLGHDDFTQQVRRAKKADPDILVLNLFGMDMIKGMRQVHQMGLDKEMQVVVPLIDINMAHTVGPEIAQDIISTVNWYWGLKDKYSGSVKFVKAYRDRYNKAPSWSAASAWVAVNEWASAVERAGTFASDQVIKELEGHQFRLLKGQERWRSWDHQAVSSVYIVKGKSESNMQGEWDLLETVDEFEGSKVVRSREENPVMLEPLQSE